MFLNERRFDQCIVVPRWSSLHYSYLLNIFTLDGCHQTMSQAWLLLKLCGLDPKNRIILLAWVLLAAGSVHIDEDFSRWLPGLDTAERSIIHDRASSNADSIQAGNVR